MIPQWVDSDSWAGFVAMRRSIPKVPFTQRAQALILKELQKLKEQGYDPNEVLDQSTMNGWRGVFPTKGKPQSTEKENNDLIREMELARIQSQTPESKRARDLALSKLKVVRG